jgi:hypothetical protein
MTDTKVHLEDSGTEASNYKQFPVGYHLNQTIFKIKMPSLLSQMIMGGKPLGTLENVISGELLMP